MLKLRWLNSLRALRLTITVSFVVACGFGLTSIYLTRRLAKEIELLAEIGEVKADSASLYAQGLQMGQATRNILLDPSNQAAYANYDSAAKDFKDTLQSLKQRCEMLFPGSDATSATASIETDFKAHLDVQHRIHELARNGNFEEGKKELNSSDTPLWRKYKKTILDHSAWLGKQASQTSSRAQQDSLWAQTLSWFSGFLLIAASLAAFMTSAQVGRALHRFAELLLVGAKQITSAAGQVSSSSDSLATGATEQAASLEQTSAAGKEIDALASRNTENCRSAAELVAKSQDRGSAINGMLDQAVASLEEINASSDSISLIVKTINDIAFQTNILALNAAIEAARAGETGAGFGVVADEVRNLAQRCAKAANETAALVEGSVAKSRDGKIKVGEVVAAIRATTEETAQVRMLVDQVSSGSVEQAKGIEQISQALTKMEQVTQAAAASAQEGAAAATELHAQSDSLSDIVDRLNAIIGNNGPGAHHSSVYGQPAYAEQPVLPAHGDSAIAVSARSEW